MPLRDRVRAMVDIIFPAATPAVATPATTSMGLRPKERTRRSRRTSPLPVNRTRWLQADIETASHYAANGDMTIAAQIYRSLQRDGTIQGLLGTRCGGLVRLPKKFAGTPEAVSALQGVDGRPGLFEKIFPTAELKRLSADGLWLVGVAEFVQKPGCDYPVLTRLDPEFLTYRQWEDQWYYRSTDGLVPVTPGDGRWVLYTPHGRYEPWNHGLWQALSRAGISKEHALLYRENYAGKLANPARVAVSPQGASEGQKQAWWKQVMAWGVNSVFGVTPGYDVKLLESNGRGYEVFKDIIADAKVEIMIEISGNEVVVTGGAGFANADIHATIRSDLIQADGDALAACLNEQALPHVVYDFVGPGQECVIAWDTRPPADLKAGAESLTAAAKAIADCTNSLAAHGLELDVGSVCARFQLPLLGDADADGMPDQPTQPKAPDVSTLSAQLAEKMTRLKLPRCEHGFANRCRICGIERARDVELDDKGRPVWSIAWQPIGAPVAAPAAPPAAEETPQPKAAQS